VQPENYRKIKLEIEMKRFREGRKKGQRSISDLKK